MTILIPASLTSSEKRELLDLLEERERRRSKRQCEESLAEFVRQAWHLVEPGAKLRWNWHLDVICAYLEAYFERRITRLIFNVPPGSMKSLLVSVFGPAWAWTRDPSRRFINLTNEVGLATRDSLRMRQVVQSDWYQGRWGDAVQISADQREKMHFANTATGFRQGLGITGSVTGKRGTDLLIDDPLDAQKAFSDVETQTVNDTYDNAISSRLNDLEHDGIVLIMQRLRTNDLTGHLLSKKATKWVQVRIPMEYDGEPGYDPVADLGPEYAHLTDPRTEIGELMFPARFTRHAVDALKEDLGKYGTAGQLQQRPTPLGGGILRKDLWQKWPKDLPFPTCHHIFASYDTAYSDADHKKSAYSARTTWGVFDDPISGRPAMIMIDRWYERADYAALKKEARQHYKVAGCDRLLIERKASGISLIQDLRRMRGVSVRGYDPGKLDKIGRAHMALPMLGAGLVYYPDRKWAEEVVDLVAAFPNGAPPSADLADTVTQAINYVRKQGWAQPSEDDRRDDLAAHDQTEEEQDDAPPKRRAAYG